jgi:cobalt-zinc-cadmium efflux system protein
MAHEHDDDHDFGHNHNHALSHSHAPKSFGFAFALGTALNFGFVTVEVAFGILSNSMALLADAGHNLGDVLGLLIAWGASALAGRRPTARYTYGLRSSSILAALANAIFLLVATGGIAWEAIRRFAEPEPVAGIAVMIVAGIGIGVNGFTAWLFASGRKGDINIRGAFLHMLSDAAVSTAVAVAGLVILFTDWEWLDPVVSLIIAMVIIWGTWGLLRDAVKMSLDAVPPGIEPANVRAYLEGLAGVVHIHDLHIWSMSTTETALTCHLVMPDGHPGDAFTARVASELHHRFGIGHATLQIEVDEDIACALEPDHVV